MTTESTRVFFIGGRQSDAGLTPNVVGGKAAHLVRLDGIGLRVPPALALTTALCRHYMAHGALPDGFRTQLAGSLRQLEEATGCTLGHSRPLLVSVRSSPPVSMPGMLDTVLNVGLTEPGVRGLIRRTGNPWLAWDAFRRLVRSFADTVGHAPADPFERLAAQHLARYGVTAIQDLDPLALRDLARKSAQMLHASGAPLPADPLQQIVEAVEAVLRSWAAPRAREYRRLNGFDDEIGTGVLVQAMVFGNAGQRSGAGVGFTRNPSSGDDELYVDFAFNAQGEDVVSGRHTVTESSLLPTILPQVWAELQDAKSALEREFRDMQDFEFTVEEGQLFFLQTRAAKRTPWAALRIAIDLVRAGVIDSHAAIEQLASYDLETIARVAVQTGPADAPIAHAVPASVGAASGRIVFDVARAQALAPSGPVVLLRTELSTDDVAGISAAAAIVTTVGARTSHAAVVARQLGTVCLVACSDLRVDEAARACTFGTVRLREGDTITVDGNAGVVYAGRVPIVVERPEAALSEVEAWRRSTAA